MHKFKSLFTIFVALQLSAGLPHQTKSSDHDDDSDMWMEADELPPPEYSVVRSESRVVRQYQSTPEHGASVTRVENFEPQVVVSSTSSDPQTPTPAEQNFFPSFFGGVPLSGHARPYKFSPNTVAASIAGRYSASGRAQTFDQSILGSGDFSVIRGGTFYPEEERKYQPKASGSELFDSLFNNGHGRPNAEALTAKKDIYYPEDPFENFKDFADIQAGSDPAYSHFVVIYANKNSTKPHPSHPRPKNIFEQLQLLDLEKENEKNEIIEEPESDKKLMKLSKFKTKLSKTKVVKKYKKKLGPKNDYTDPLLATS